MGQDPAVYDKRLFPFLQDPQLFNSYTYTRNNLLIYIDPTGELIVHTDDATEEQIEQFYNDLGQLINDVKNNAEIVDYYNDVYGIDIINVLTDDTIGPDVYLGGQHSDEDFDWGGSIAGYYNGWTNNVSIYDKAFEKNIVDSTLIHELEHWANDIASWWGNLNPELDDYNQYTNLLDKKLSSVNKIMHGYYGYMSEVILYDEVTN